MKKAFKKLSIGGLSVVLLTLGFLVSYAASEDSHQEPSHGESSYFTDVEGHWASQYIKDLTDAGVVSGYEDGTFRPESQVTNAAFLSMVVEAIEQVEDRTQMGWIDSDFDTNPDTDPEANRVNQFREGQGQGDRVGLDQLYIKAAELQLIDRQDPNDMVAIYPKELITREEGARIIYQALKHLEAYEYNKGLNDDVVSEDDKLLEAEFKDIVTVNTYYQKGVRGVLMTGLMNGDGQGSFNPKGLLNRGQACVMIDKLMKPLLRGDQNAIGQVKMQYFDEAGQWYVTDYVNQDNRDLMDLLCAVQSNHYGSKVLISHDFSDSDNRVVKVTYYESEAAYQQSKNAIFTLNLYLDQGIKSYSDKKIEINIPQRGEAVLDISQNPSSNFILNYLFGCIECYVSKDYASEGQDYSSMIVDYYDELSHKKVGVNQSEGVEFSTYWRQIEIVKYQDHLSILTTPMRFKDGQVQAFEDNDGDQVSCSEEFESIEFPENSHITNVCNESVNTILDSIINEKRSDVLVLDVRTPEEYSEGFIEGAVNIPVDELSAHLDEVNQYDYVLVYCQSGGRSAKAAKLLSEQNQDMKIFNLSEGYPAYERIEEVSE